MTKKKTRRPIQSGAHRPIADKLIQKMRGYLTAKVVDLGAIIEGKKNAEAMQQTVATHETLASFHPAHAIYIYAQNQTSVMSEQLTELPEMERFAQLIGNAEDQYIPGGPPMSPLTASFFTSWAFFDAYVGIEKETVGTITMALGKAFGMNEELIRIIGLMQDSRMGIYVHEGTDTGTIYLRELVTNQVYRTICPSGYTGHPGEVWYARVLKPPTPEFDVHVVFTTPYVFVRTYEQDWLAYFDRTLPKGPPENRIAAYEKHMKWGPTRDFWNEFVFQAYADFLHEVIFLEGLPDIPESRPFSDLAL